jgi:hypothetical protein
VGRQDAIALRYCCAIAFLEVSDFYHLSHEAITSQYFGTAPANENFNHEEIKSRLNSRNACYHSVHDIESSTLLFINPKIKIYKISSCVCCFVLLLFYYY